MAGFEDIAKKAFYMGVGFAAYAQEKAGDTVKDLKIQAQKLADEMIERGEMNTEQARKFVDELVEQAQQGAVPGTGKPESREPRRIEIVDEEEKPTKQPESNQPNGGADDLRQQVQSLQEELRRLKNEKL
jgi:polyhydroxyalkanoate synthesis regulator phasin